jgi:hypothetical protein
MQNDALPCLDSALGVLKGLFWPNIDRDSWKHILYIRKLLWNAYCSVVLKSDVLRKISPISSF